MSKTMNNTIYQFEAITNRGDTVSLANYQNKVMLIVNTASACGFTPQYEGLQKLYTKHQEQGLEILAFPCNQFKQKEKGTRGRVNDAQISFKYFPDSFKRFQIKILMLLKIWKF